MDKTPTTLEDIEDLLQENIEATKENTKLLKAMRRDALIGGILKTLIWIVLIAASLYFSVKFIEPYMGLLQQGANQSTGQMDYQSLIDEYQRFMEGQQ